MSDSLLLSRLVAKIEADKQRSEAAKKRDRKPDGTLASGSTNCRTTGSRDKTNQAKAAASNSNRGAVARGDKFRLELDSTGEVPQSDDREGRDIDQDQRYLIWKHCQEQSDQWQAARLVAKIEADKQRSEAAKKRDRKPDGTLASGGTLCPTTGDRHKGKAAKAAASNSNRGAVARGDKLAKHRPDLAEGVRLGKIKSADARAHGTAQAPVDLR
jgi:hypothetical protein